ncbi:MAG: hypothetical protein AAFS10_07355 [Myxococcota bacterium]
MNRRHPHSVPCLLVSLLVLALLISCRSDEEDATWIFDAGGSDIRDATPARDAPGSNGALDASETLDTAPYDAADTAPPDAIAQDTPQPSDTPQNTDTASTDTSPEDAPPTDTSEPVQEDTSVADAELPPFADDDFCHEVEEFGAVFGDAIQTWVRQDDRSPPAPGGLVIVGSSTVRRWEGFAQAYSDHAPIQRGFGGAQLGEVALFAETLVVRHNPRAVVVFAGTNDVAAGVSAPIVVERFRCLRQRIGRGLGWERPVLFVGITPTPARWESWSVAMEVNRGIKALEVWMVRCIMSMCLRLFWPLGRRLTAPCLWTMAYI